MKYSLYIKIFENQQKQKDLEMIYTEDFEWVKTREKAKKYINLSQFCIQLDLILVCCVLMSACAMIMHPEIIFLKALTLALGVTSLIFCIIFNSIVIIKYNKYKNWQADYEKTYEYLNQISKIIEKREKINDLRRRNK